MRWRLGALSILGALAIVGLVAGILYSRRARRPVTTLLVSGNVEAHESVLSFRVQGRILELPIEEGQWVESGATLARLDPRDYRQQVHVDRATVEQRDAQLQLSLAGTRIQQLRASAETVGVARAELDFRRSDFRRVRALRDEAATTPQSVDLAAANLQRADAAWRRAQQNYDEAHAGSRKEQIRIDRANVDVARQNMDLSRIRLSFTTLRAPRAGVITVRDGELGEVVSPGTPVATLADLDHVWLRAWIAETDLGRVRWGQSATISTDTPSVPPRRGRVSFISSVAEFTPKSVETHRERVMLVYRIKIDVENQDHALKPGMPADALIDLAGEPVARPNAVGGR